MTDYQYIGFIAGFNSSALSKINTILANYKRLTPVHLHNKYKSYIRYNKSRNSYEFGWVLR